MKERGVYRKTKLIYGWGVNDSTYVTEHKAIVDGVYKTVWRCPVYQDWRNILERGFCPTYKTKRPTYKDVTVSEDFKSFMSYRYWVLNVQPNKDWKNCIPDKDILIYENKIYSPDTIVYVNKELNTFVTDANANRGKYMIGVVDFRPENKYRPYRARCCNPFVGKQEHLGYFPTEMEAHKAWQAKKHEHALRLAEEQEDPRVADALRKRYAPDTDWTNR